MLPAKLIIPRAGLEPVTFDARPDRIYVTDYGLNWVRDEFRKSGGIGGGSGQFSSWAEQAIINHAWGQDNASWANLSPVFLALCTVVPTSTSTGSTITEATYTGYARKSVANTDVSAASGTAPASASNANTLTFAACTAGTSTIIAAAACTASSAGNVIFWFSTPSTVISTTQTPATVAASGITLSLT